MVVPARRLALRIAVAAGLLLALASPARGGELDAPLSVGTEGPVRTLFLDMPVADARVPRRRELTLRWQGSNSWSAPTAFTRGNDLAYAQLDTQADAVSLALRVPWSALGRRGATSFGGTLTLWSGGWSDGLVEGWHHALGFTNFERQEYPRNKVRLMFRDDRHVAFDTWTARWSLGRFVVRNQLLLAEGGSSLRATGEDRSRWALSLRLDAKLPTGSPGGLSGSGGGDVGVGVIGTAELARWCVLHANVFTSAWSGLSGGTILQPRRFHHGAELSVAFTSEHWALIAEDRLLSPILASDWKTIGTDAYADLAASAAFGLTRAHNQISVGVRRGMFTAWFSEDFTPSQSLRKHVFFNSNAPDISVGFEIARSL